jgi:hypothetical protein
MHAGILQRKWKGRDEVQEVEKIDGDKDEGDGGIESPPSGSEVFACHKVKEAEEEIQKREADGSAQQEDEPADGVQHDRQNENCEAEQREKEETELKGKAREMLLEFFISHKGRAENQEKRPAHPEAAAVEIEDQESAEQPAEKELQRADEPDVGPRRVSGIRGAIFRAVEQENAGAYDDEVHDHPEIFQKRVDAFER